MRIKENFTLMFSEKEKNILDITPYIMVDKK